ncbi:DUF4232 domain-containing protein [Streptomyces aureus]
MRRPNALLPALAATTLLLTACGTEPADSGNTSANAAGPSPRTQVDDPGKDGVRITSLTLPSASPSPTRSTSVSADGLATMSGVSATYEVTNSGTKTLTYSVVFSFMSSDGGAMGNQTVTVRDVAPGKTVRGTVRAAGRCSTGDAGQGPRGRGAGRAGNVPRLGHPGQRGPGRRGHGPARRGPAPRQLRQARLRGRGLSGLELLDDDPAPVDGIEILDGSGEISPTSGADEQPGPSCLHPGSRRPPAWPGATPPSPVRQ